MTEDKATKAIGIVTIILYTAVIVWHLVIPMVTLLISTGLK